MEAAVAEREAEVPGLAEVEELRRAAERIGERLRELEDRERELRRRLSELPLPEGSLNYRWVRNSQGRVYRYWYIIYHRDGRRYHRYVGKKLPEPLRRMPEARRLLRELRALEREREELLRRLRRALGVLGL